MSKKALVSIKSFTDLDKKDVIEVVTPGEFFVDEDRYRAVYKETEISGMDGTITTLIASDDCFTLEREGTTTTKMNFKKGETDISLYSTKYGVMDLQIHTKYLEMDVNEDGGNIVAKYSMTLSGQQPINTKIMINIKVE